MKMRMATALTFLAVMIPAAYAAEARKVAYTADFETGQVQAATKTHDGFYIRTLPDPQEGDDALISGQGGFGPDTASDTRVVTKDSIGGETIWPRSGTYFLRSAIYYTKDYRPINDGTTDRPRSMIYLSNEVHHVPYDTEGFIGFSVYTPLNYEHEVGTKGDAGGVTLFSMNSTPSRTFFALKQFVPSGKSEAHWWLVYHVDDSSTEESADARVAVDLGPVRADIGKWTDFVIRYRANPFSVSTNPAAKGIPNAKDETFGGNLGILQVWKAEGSSDSSGNRGLVMKLDKVNTPVGLVPHESDEMMLTWRVYKYAWKKNPTSVKGPIWFGFDEIRHGLVVRDDTGFDDVVPASLVQETPVPRPPDSLAVD
jgi:hypothetical protein